MGPAARTLTFRLETMRRARPGSAASRIPGPAGNSCGRARAADYDTSRSARAASDATFIHDSFCSTTVASAAPRRPRAAYGAAPTHRSLCCTTGVPDTARWLTHGHVSAHTLGEAVRGVH